MSTRAPSCAPSPCQDAGWVEHFLELRFLVVCLFVFFFFEWFFGPFDICLRERVNISCLRMAQIGSLMVQVGREIDLVYRCLKIWGC